MKKLKKNKDGSQSYVSPKVLSGKKSAVMSYEKAKTPDQNALITKTFLNTLDERDAYRRKMSNPNKVNQGRGMAKTPGMSSKSRRNTGK